MPNQKSSSIGLFICGVVKAILFLALNVVGIAMIVRARGESNSEFWIDNANVPMCMAWLVILPMAILSLIGSRQDFVCCDITLLSLGIVDIFVLLVFFSLLFTDCLDFDTGAEPLTVRDRIRQHPDTLAWAETETALLGIAIAIFSVMICCVTGRICNCERFCAGNENTAEGQRGSSGSACVHDPRSLKF